MELKTNYSLKNENTFRVDASAQYFAKIFSEDDLRNIIKEKKDSSFPVLILGGGSNILFSKNYEGIVIKNSIGGISLVEENEDSIVIEAGAGVKWDDFVTHCVEKNYGGIENLSLIPGTVGAAPIQNIGAYGQEIKDTFYYLKGIFLADLSSKTFAKEDCGFGYRESIFKSELKGKFVITSLAVRLSKKPQINLSYTAVKEELEKLSIKEPTIKDVSRIVRMIRESKLPDPNQIGNAGSFFKNPEINESLFLEIKNNFEDFKGYKMSNESYKISAAWLIEKCGWKGKRIGNTGVYKSQPLVLVNFDNASGSEILGLALQIKESVYNKFKIILEEEVNIF